MKVRLQKPLKCVQGLLLGMLPLMVFTPGCRDEVFYGPYHIEVPTVLMEHTAGRTFRLPLNGDELRESDALKRCLSDEPYRATPCKCDYPVLTIYDHLIQLDYRVVLLSGLQADVLVWTGVEVELDQPFPDILPDLPRVEVIAAHYHSLVGQGHVLEASFLETEMMEMILQHALSRYNICELETDMLPAPTEIMFGISLISEQSAQLGLDVTFRLREYK